MSKDRTVHVKYRKIHNSDLKYDDKVTFHALPTRTHAS